MVAAREPWVGGNWKSFGTTAEVERWCKTIRSAPGAGVVEVVVCPSPVHITQALDLLRGSHIAVAAQNVSKTGPGPFTGEVNAHMLQDLGVEWTLVGHSERRSYYGETDQIVAEKVERALKTGLRPIICVGERLEQRQAGEVEAVLNQQMDAILSKVTDLSRVVIAYEPVWAIGTGVVASPEQAESAHQILRQIIRKHAGDAAADAVRIVYGGSVSEKNCEALIAEPNIDGFLVGGASLKPEFNIIIDTVAGHAKTKA